MIRFSLFGIPVEIQPFFWLILAFLGGILRADSSAALFATTLFVFAGLVSILIHELGHALVGRKLGGGYASIVLTSFGGLAMNHGGRFTRNQRLAMVAAGPGAGFAFLLLIIAFLGLFFGPMNVLALAGRLLFGVETSITSPRLAMFLASKPFVFLLIFYLFQINFWWGVINLLPVMPLDGGRIAELFIRPQRRVFSIGFITALAMAILSYLWLHSLYTAALFGFLAWQNYRNMRENSWQ